MKVMKLRAASGIVAGSLLAIGLVAQAQEKKDATPATPVPAVPAVKPAAPAARPDIRASRVEMRLKGMAASLGLTDEQKEKVKPIIEEEITRMEQLQKEPRDRNAPPEERMKKIREIREASMAKMKPILTAEQQAKLDNLRPRPQRRPDAPTATPAAPAAPAAPATK